MRPRTPVTTSTRLPDVPLPLASSVSRRLNAERLVLLGWSRAILLQLAHPLIAAAVYDHSTFGAGAWAAVARLRSTIRAMLALTFGTDAEREYALHGIRRIHRRVNGTLPDPVGAYAPGSRYSAEDGNLVLWVHVTLLDSVPLVYDRFVAPLTEGDRDAFCAEAAWVAIALGTPPEQVPRTWRETQVELTRFYASGEIAVGDQARVLAEQVLSPTVLRIVPPAAWLNRLITVALLPPQIRAQYGFDWSPGRDRAFERTVRVVRATRGALPDVMALWKDART